MDSLERLWRRQLAFTSMAMPYIHGKELDQLTEDDKIALTKEYLLSLHSEVTEVLNNVPWKKHRFIGNADRDALLEELVDTQKFLWGLMLVWGVNPAELARAFNRKSDIVEQRFKQDHLLPKLVASDKVVIVDIDGVVASWKEGFNNWVKEKHPEYPFGAWDKNRDPGLRQRLKDEMHASGGMMKLQTLPNARNAIALLQQAGYQIVWLTARPINRNPRLMGDTVAWLKDNDFPTDYIYFSDLNKHIFVVDKFPMAAALFDDKPEIVAHAKEFGIQAYRVNTLDKTLADQVKEFLNATSKD